MMDQCSENIMIAQIIFVREDLSIFTSLLFYVQNMSVYSINPGPPIAKIILMEILKLLQPH